MLLKAPRFPQGIILIVLVIIILYVGTRVSNKIGCDLAESEHSHSHNHESHEHVDLTDFHIHSAEKFPLAFKVQGHQFNDKGVSKEYEHSMTSAIVHSFSPYTENRFREIILEPRHEQRVYANSPAIIWHKGELICVMRIWLEKEYYSDRKIAKPSNDLSDNFLYIQKFDRHMKPITPGGVLGIPTPRQWLVGDGPIEPRLFKTGEDVFISYNTGVYLSDGKTLDGTFFWDYNRHKTIVPTIEGGSPILKTVQPGRMPRDKHWTPYTDKDDLRLVYNLDPLRVLSCRPGNFSCKFVHFEGPDDYQFQQYINSHRGGTPWVLHEYPYYFSIGHTTLFKKPNYDREYTINLVIYRASPKPRVVYLSGPLQINPQPMRDTPIVRDLYIKDPFFFPVSLIKEDEDTIVIGGHINDYSSVLVRFRGIKTILQEVIAADKINPPDMGGPPMGTLHNSSKTMASKISGSTFYP